MDRSELTTVPVLLQVVWTMRLLWIAVNLQQYQYYCKYRKPQSITCVVVAAVTTGSELEIELWLCVLVQKSIVVLANNLVTVAACLSFPC